MPELRIGSRRVGYVRVSTDVQNTARQLDAEDLASQGIVLDMIFTDRCSGKDTKRPELQRCLDFLRGGDTLYVHSIDRLARNLADLQRIVENLNSKDLDTVGAGVTVVFLKNGLTFSGAKTSPADRLMLQMLGAFAEFEREILKERQLEGIAKAKTAGKYTGKKSKLTVDDLDAMQALKDAGISVAEIGRRYGGMTRQGVYKALRRRKKTVAATEPEQVPSAVVPPVVGGEPVETVEQQLIVDTLPAVQDGPKCSAEALKVEPEISLPDVIVVQEPDTPSVRVPAETPSAQAEPDAGRQEDRVPEFVSDAMKTAELRAEAKAVPETPAQRTPEEYWSAVKAASSIDTIPEPETYDEALYAVRQRMALWHVPERLRTPELCAEAVRFNTESLQDVPEELKTVELCMEAIRNDPYALLFVPDRMKTETLCVECVRRNGLALAGVPVEWRTPELCAEAVRECAMALGYVPEALRTPEMCRYAVQNYGLTLKDVPKALLTTEMCRKAVQNTGMALMYVPEAFRTLEMCRKAVRDFGITLKHVPDELRTRDLCLLAVKADGEALEFVPEERRTPKICLEAVTAPRQGWTAPALKWVPERRKTPDLCLAAVRADGAALEFVPEALRTPELLAVAQRGAVPVSPDIRRAKRKKVSKRNLSTKKTTYS